MEVIKKKKKKKSRAQTQPWTPQIWSGHDNKGGREPFSRSALVSGQSRCAYVFYIGFLLVPIKIGKLIRLPVMHVGL